jgi:hypothetical protein
LLPRIHASHQYSLHSYFDIQITPKYSTVFPSLIFTVLHWARAKNHSKVANIHNVLFTGAYCVENSGYIMLFRNTSNIIQCSYHERSFYICSENLFSFSQLKSSFKWI